MTSNVIRAFFAWDGSYFMDVTYALPYSFQIAIGRYFSQVIPLVTGCYSIHFYREKDLCEKMEGVQCYNIEDSDFTVSPKVASYYKLGH